MALNIDSKFNKEENIYKVKVSGDLDIYTSKSFKEELGNLVKEECLDLEILAEDLNYIDSTGLGVLMSILKDVKEKDCNIYINGAKPNIRKIFDITELDKLFIFRGESNE